MTLFHDPTVNCIPFGSCRTALDLHKAFGKVRVRDEGNTDGVIPEVTGWPTTREPPSEEDTANISKISLSPTEFPDG